MRETHLACFWANYVCPTVSNSESYYTVYCFRCFQRAVVEASKQLLLCTDYSNDKVVVGSCSPPPKS